MGCDCFFRFLWGDVGFERAGCTVGLRGIRPARAEEASERIGLSRCARGGGLFASKARFGRVPLPPGATVSPGRRCRLSESGGGSEGRAIYPKAPGLVWLAARWGSAGSGLRGLRRLLKGESFRRAVREGVVCSPPRLASAVSRCRPGAMVSLGRRCRLSELSGSSGGRAISPKAPRLARPVRRSKPYRERRWVGRGGRLRRCLSWAAILRADEVEGDGVAS